MEIILSVLVLDRVSRSQTQNFEVAEKPGRLCALRMKPGSSGVSRRHPQPFPRGHIKDLPHVRLSPFIGAAGKWFYANINLAGDGPKPGGRLDGDGPG